MKTKTYIAGLEPGARVEILYETSALGMAPEDHWRRGTIENSNDREFIIELDDDPGMRLLHRLTGPWASIWRPAGPLCTCRPGYKPHERGGVDCLNHVDLSKFRVLD